MAMILKDKIEESEDVNISALKFLIKHIYRKNILTLPEILDLFFQCVGIENKRFQKKEINNEYLKCRFEEFKRLKALMGEDNGEIKRKKKFKYS